MPVKGYKAVTLREELVEAVKKALPKEVHRTPDPTSVSGFVTLAVQEKLERMAKEGGR